MISLISFGIGACVGVLVFAFFQPDYDEELVKYCAELEEKHEKNEQRLSEKSNQYHRARAEHEKRLKELQDRLNEVKLENEWLKQKNIQLLDEN